MININNQKAHRLNDNMSYMIAEGGDERIFTVVNAMPSVKVVSKGGDSDADVEPVILFTGNYNDDDDDTSQTVIFSMSTNRSVLDAFGAIMSLILTEEQIEKLVGMIAYFASENDKAGVPPMLVEVWQKMVGSERE